MKSVTSATPRSDAHGRVKTVRFSAVVEACGRPRPHTLWLPPEKDPELKRAIAAHRVLTLTGGKGKADHGEVGFSTPTHAGDQYFIFPKSLRRFTGRRVVGVKFEMVEQPQLVAVRAKDVMRPPPPARKPAHASPANGEVVSFAPQRPPEKSGPKTSRAPSTPKPHAPAVAQARATAPSADALVREVRAALRELKTGKTVAAYQRLEKTVRS